MRLLKKFFLFATELVFLFFGSILSMGSAAYLDSVGSKIGPVAFFLGLSLICTVLVWFRRKTLQWTIAADATAWLNHRSWRQLHPRRAKYLRNLQRCFLLIPTLCSVLVLFFLPVASHILYSRTHLIPHYRCYTPLNWLVIKSPGGDLTRVFFSNQGAARYGLTPIWFNHSMPSGAIFFTSDPEQAFGWNRPESELATGHTTHLAVRQF